MAREGEKRGDGTYFQGEEEGRKGRVGLAPKPKTKLRP